uniref:Uncharacterized protein n=1 Tax=Trypanosoma congolense (strain IL3000) TaxID=1068625 RepID=G0UXL0_TRYCI|nr:conserved hypothetical protein [Trypanosoma congolense IL3000]
MGVPWSRTTSFMASGSAPAAASTTGVDASTTTVVSEAADVVLEADAGPLTGRQKAFLVGTGILCMGAFTLFSVWCSGNRGSPQILWDAEGCRMRDATDCIVLELPAAGRSSKLKLALVNFPESLGEQFRRCVRPLIDAVEVDFVDVPVIFYHEATELTPSNVVAVVRQEVRAAFDELQRTPCVVYRSAVAVDDESVNPFWTPSQTLEALRGRTFHEQHCIGYTVDGSRVEVLEHDVHGEISPTASATALSDSWRSYRVVSVEEALRHCFCATPRTFSAWTNKSQKHFKNLKPHAETVLKEVPCSSAFRELWLCPRPLFAMFGAALRFSRVEFDGWNHLSNPQGGELPWLVEELGLRRWWGSQPVDKPREVGCCKILEQQREQFLLEITIVQDTSFLTEAHRSALKEMLICSRRYCSNGLGAALNYGVECEEIVDVFPNLNGKGAVIHCHFPPALTVFQALRESWGLASFASYLGYDVTSFRLLAPVIIFPAQKREAPVDGKVQSCPSIPRFPRSQGDLEVWPSFFCSAQYFCTLRETTVVETSRAFSYMEEGNTHDLHYVIAEYSMHEL